MLAMHTALQHPVDPYSLLKTEAEERALEKIECGLDADLSELAPTQRSRVLLAAALLEPPNQELVAELVDQEQNHE